MPSGLAALLDDVAGIAKIAAASVDDISGAAGKAGAKAVGVVVDDTAVTPGYAVGFTPDRELPIIAKIAVGSLRNKLLFLLPGALLLSAFAPWGVTPLLMAGGAYLCFEATEKILEGMGFGHHHDSHTVHVEELALSSQELERQKVGGAIRTDLILSAEIMAIALADVSDRPLAIQAAALAIVGVAITIIVYGVVAFIVKMDDIGLHLAQRPSRGAKVIGRALVQAMPPLLEGLTLVGTAAMLWVGGGIIVHGLEHFHVPVVPGAIEALKHWAAGAPGIGALTGWLAFAVASAAVGFVVGGAIVALLAVAKRARRKPAPGPATRP
jgi:uncharacterized protein